jgi:hypothetical protein
MIKEEDVSEEDEDEEESQIKDIDRDAIIGQSPYNKRGNR